MKQTTRKTTTSGKKKSRLRIGGSRGWIAAGTLAAYAAMGATKAAMASVEKVDPAASGAVDASLPLKKFDIPAGPLDAAVKAFERATGLTVKVVLPSGTVAGFNSQGVVGLYREDEALRLLLEGTGLNYRVEDATTMLVGVQAKDTVSVTDSVTNSVSLSKFTEPLIDTPQSVNVVPQFVLKDEGVSTLRDALRNVPGISLAAGEAGAQGDNLTIRGFTARNDIFLDGIRDFGSYYRDAFNYEQVEALEGPAGIQFGRGSTGGVINQESKVPVVQQFVNVQTQFGTDKTRRLTADINEPELDVLGGTAYRVNLMGQEGGVAGRDYAEVRRFGIAPSVSIGLNTKTRATLSYLHMTESDTPDYGLPWFNNAVAPGSIRHSYYGFPDENYLKTNDDILTFKAEHEFSPNLNLHTIARAANYPRQAQITEPQICSNAPASVPVGGFVSSLPTSAVNTALPCAYTAASDPSKIIVNRNQIQTKSVEGDLWDQTEVTARFKTFGTKHALVAGVEGGQEISNPIRTSYTINKVNTVPTANLIDPNAQQPFGGTGYISSIVHTKAKSVGIYFVDTIKLGRLFEASGGVRWDRFDTGYNLYQPTPPTGGTVTAPVAPISRIDEQPSYRAAFVYKPSSRGTVYFDYGTSFNPAAESLSLSIGLANSSAAPEENETYEVGAKWSFLNERLLAEGSWFRTEKDNARETDPTNSNNIVAAGNQLVKGVQFSLVGRLPEGMDIVAGYAYLDSAVIFSKFFPTSVGFPLANVPKQTFNLFVTHRLPLRLNVGLGGNYVASRTASSTVPYVPTAYSGPISYLTASGAPAVHYQVLATEMKQVPGYWIFNAMVRRPLTDRLELQANVNNLLNRYYIDLPHPSHLIPGAGANAQIGINFKF
ncbi:TonB-dependent siderophore receptor [Tunturibacter empetritectus]|uniref:Catecholate siderophore receptor n=1 Tax=Tunturiibacter empetritectus TaxID=3069691 RepID=A0A7W8IKG8_9BACT|nr:TonB-dependent siderophore receptor [Edaphobacter lichenicola]MBB5318738.1 catecholate siderophore receptor [Edaphobacter lichenicola]